MRRIITVFYLFVVFALNYGCNSSDKSKEIAGYGQAGSNVELAEPLKAKVGSWIKEGAECYGIVMVQSTDLNLFAIREVKAKVLVVQSNKIKMKALEDVSVAPKAGCNKMGITKGETWWEEEGDLFQSKEEAAEFARTIMEKQKKPTGKKFTID